MIREVDIIVKFNSFTYLISEGIKNVFKNKKASMASLVTMICAMIISLIDLAFPQILNYLNDTLYIADHQTIIQSLFWLAVFLLIMYAIRALCKYYVSAQGHIMGAQMERDMRKDLFDKFEQLSFSYYDRNNTGEMMSKLVSDLFDICSYKPIKSPSIWSHINGAN